MITKRDMEKKRKRGDLKKGGKRDGQYILDLPKGVVEQEENDNDNAVFQSDNNTQVKSIAVVVEPGVAEATCVLQILPDLLCRLF